MSNTRASRFAVQPMYCQVVLLVTLLCGYVCPAFAQVLPADPELVGWWKFDEPAGSQIQDSSGRGNDGAMSTPGSPVFAGSSDVAVASPQRIVGRFGGALRFDRNQPSVVRVPDSTSLRTPYVTMAAWIRNDGFPGLYNYFWTKGGQDCWGPTFSLNTEGDSGLNMRLTSNGYEPVGGTVDTLVPQLWDGQWHYVVGMYDQVSSRLYIDGQLISQSTVQGTPLGHELAPATDFFIGGFVGSCFIPGSGDIDELRIWDRTFDTPPSGDNPQYAIALLYDVTKVNRSGSTVPLKIDVRDIAGSNVSSDSLAVTAIDRVLRETNVTGTVEDSGSSNPDSGFRFDPAQGAGGGYIYNYNTKGLATGTYDLTLSIGNDPHPYTISFSVK